jgi:sugar phosphate isomerase/epimerase
MDIGASLYVFTRSSTFHDDLPATLAALAHEGYVSCEPFLKDVLAAPGAFRKSPVPLCGVHTVTAELTDVPKLLRSLEQADVPVVCNSGLIEWDKRSPDDYRRAAALLNRIGRKLAQAGRRLCYHNHQFEFEPVDGARTGMQILLQELDADSVDLCFDMGWPVLVGADPVSFMRQHGERISYLHLRDFAGDRSVALGEGGLALADVVAALGSLPRLRSVVVEQDPGPADPLQSMRVSRKYLRNSFGL